MNNQKPPPKNSPSSAPAAGGASEREYEKLVRQVADRVWAMWREELRRSRERARPKSGR